MAGKFQIRSRKWDLGILIASVVALMVGLGGLFVLAGSNSTGSKTNLFVILLGILTFLGFSGPGIVYVLRKRVKWLKARLPGGTMTWIRSHLYLPVLALVLALAHAWAVPFRGTLSSGKVLLALGVLVSIAGLARHHLIGIQKAALNVDVAIGKLTTGQPRHFRRLVADYTDNKRSRQEVDAAMAQFDPALQERWRKITEISDEVEKHFPRSGGQSWHIRQYKFWKALHPPLTIALFLVLAFHVWDVLGGTRAVAGDDHRFAAASECADCHSDVFDEWAGSTMSHAATSTINEAQLPITLAENRRIIEEFDGTDSLATLTGRDLDRVSQQDIVEDNAHVCIDCHTPIGGSFTDDPFELLPFGESPSTINGNAAVTSDGVGCVTCHSIESPPAELAGASNLMDDQIQTVSGGGYGTMYGPLFTGPAPLPVRIHSVETPDSRREHFWSDELETSQLCGACHNVKLDIDGDGLSDVDGAEDQGIVEIVDAIDDGDDLDADGDFQLDENELDDDRVNTADGEANQDDGGDGLIDDLVLQTTYDEWQDYVAFFDVDGGFTDRYADAEFPNDLSRPLGCTSCHMPFSSDGVEQPIVDEAPGLLSVPDRLHRQHTFVGVDYDLDPDLYRKNGLSDEDIANVLAERDALVQSAATVQVVPGDVIDTANGQGLEVDVNVRNNLLAHSFPTGFAFARQFWLEVSAVDGDGNPVCLAPAFVDGDGAPIINTPCGSGFADAEGTEPVEGAEELRQCDVNEFLQGAGDVFAGSGLPIDAIGDTDIAFAPDAAFPADECDPWLANFQKILTDGDPDGDGTRQEVPYQPLLPDAVKTRAQMASGIEMTELQPVRLREVDGELVDDDVKTIPYVFDISDGTDPSDVHVTARLRFRHIPPYFVKDLDARQEDLGDGIPPGARIDADQLLQHLAVSEVVSATSDDPTEQLGCEGPQNGEQTILDCVDDGDVRDAGERLNLDVGGSSDDGGRFQRDEEGLAHRAEGFAPFALPGIVAPFGAWLRRQRRRRRLAS